MNERAWIMNGDEAIIDDGCVLYRITSLNHSDECHMLNGMAPVHTRSCGRWHRPMQTATYTSNNLLVCMAEVLYHNFRTLLNGIRAGFPPAKLKASYASQKVLQIARVTRIDNLAHTESDDFQREYKLYGTALVFPDPIYELFHKINDDLRGAVRKKRGIVYPSARHSRDFCAALFTDETTSISGFWKIGLTLALVHENQHPGEPPLPADPSRDRIHPTMGYYQFDDEASFSRLDAERLLHPSGVPCQGYIEFVRRPYKLYPEQAIGACRA